MTLDWEGFNQPGKYSKRQIDVNGVERIYYFYVPSTYDGKKAVPVVIDTHGGFSSPLAQWSSSRTDRLAEREGLIAVAPEYADIPDVTMMSTDVPFVAALLDELEAEYRIDPSASTRGDLRAALS